MLGDQTLIAADKAVMLGDGTPVSGFDFEQTMRYTATFGGTTLVQRHLNLNIDSHLNMRYELLRVRFLKPIV